MIWYYYYWEPFGSFCFFEQKACKSNIYVARESFPTQVLYIPKGSYVKIGTQVFFSSYRSPEKSLRIQKEKKKWNFVHGFVSTRRLRKLVACKLGLCDVALLVGVQTTYGVSDSAEITADLYVQVPVKAPVGSPGVTDDVVGNGSRSVVPNDLHSMIVVSVSAVALYYSTHVVLEWCRVYCC